MKKEYAWNFEHEIHPLAERSESSGEYRSFKEFDVALDCGKKV